ncbi:hypothetical protein EFP34_14545 [Lacticaseibacillus paracasei]|uniref:Eco57I restriction-modification methylase domain-containing protein n=1 Tax=Lacticaseibacillus paracasei TaxID=1597 RepID=UPI001157495C|nr:Eco57I restriction-modification methylase domain-containing protein [Lacticaseibacillus paracasei]MCT3351706.1 hypothetical protein [Lacticaseibacillus paracasei]VTZ84791.1 hypothetical protein LPCP272_02809 [Lacticaseibacillus paracasei]
MAIQEHKKLGQYLTPAAYAKCISKEAMRAIANSSEVIHVLDPGTGNGQLIYYLLDSLNTQGRLKPSQKLDIVICDIDGGELIHAVTRLHNWLVVHKMRERVCISSFQLDFIKSFPINGWTEKFDLIVMNPPYRRLSNSDESKLYLNNFNMASDNLYSEFLDVGRKYLKKKGFLISLTPRSFLNGVYFTKFRIRFFKEMAIRRIYLFSSRKIFESALQEVTLMVACKDNHWEPVSVVQLRSIEDPIKENETIISPKLIVDKNDFSFLLAKRRPQECKNEIQLGKIKDIEMHTGKVVQFRDLTEDAILIQKTGERDIPFILPEHLDERGKIDWPKIYPKKGNYIRKDAIRESKLIYGQMFLVISRFSTVEQHRRIKAAIFLNPNPKEPIAFDNKLNVIEFHNKSFFYAKKLLNQLLSKETDVFIRGLSGSTQININDLRKVLVQNF